MAVKKIPLRRCAGCNEQKSKKEFVRVVRTPEGEIMLDFKGKMNGRGAYICKNKDCLKKARQKGRIEQSLECSISSEIYTMLEERIENAE